MAILSGIPRGLMELFETLPSPGNRNIWIFTVAKRARHFASKEKTRQFLLRVCSEWHDRDFTPEIDRAISRAYNEPTTTTHQSREIPTWPKFSVVAWERRKTHPPLFFENPVKISPESVIDQLFLPASLICAAIDTQSAITLPRDEWRGKEPGLQFIVANPMTAISGINQSGRTSARCLDNSTRSKTHQVVEFDRGTRQEQIAILSSMHHPTTPLVLAVWSGGKSLHGWFDVRKLSEYGKLRFFRHSVFLGSDPTLWDPSKLVRMPGGRRSTGQTQHILHFNPPTK